MKSITMQQEEQQTRELLRWEQRAEPKRRPHSQAIPIHHTSAAKRTTAMGNWTSSSTSSASSNADHHYEYATWKMFNRIIDHRQKHPLSANYHQDQEEVTPATFRRVVKHEAGANIGHRKCNHLGQRTPQNPATPMMKSVTFVGHEDYEEEVFEMDL